MRGGLLRSHGGPGAILVEDVPTPPLGENQVLIKVKASSLNRIDALIRAGQVPNPPQLPLVLGRDGAGVVEQVSENVFNFHPGDRVFFVSSRNGANADYVVVDPNFVFPLPSRISFAQGATLGVAYFAAYRALFMKAGAQAGQSIFIHGVSGGVGLAAAELAKVHGLRVFGTAGTPEGEQLAKKFCEKVWNHKDASYVETVKSEFSQGFDVILEMVAHVNLANDLELAARNGRVVIVGNSGNIEINPDQAIGKEASIVGLYADDTNAHDYQRIAERLIGLLEGGHITPIVGRKFQLEHLPDAHNQLESPGATGKIVLIHDQDAEEGAQGQSGQGEGVPEGHGLPEGQAAPEGQGEAGGQGLPEGQGPPQGEQAPEGQAVPEGGETVPEGVQQAPTDPSAAQEGQEVPEGAPAEPQPAPEGQDAPTQDQPAAPEEDKPIPAPEAPTEPQPQEESGDLTFDDVTHAGDANEVKDS